MSVMNDQKMSWTALLMGVLSFIFAPFALIGVVTGHMARSRVENFPHQYAGGGKALLGLLLSYFVLAVFVILLSLLIMMYNDGQLMSFLKNLDESGQLFDFAKSLGLREKE
ncbi:MAG: Unknown protein [uncultured Thiotrichaceae bacterium]|uniref:DUF4190 domain-containing protein n=1 Tax=uncultured Thiotrichaceae bacterium TaxID=298394 RepID=A0A6S6SI67_9GAMM|nr:MAG: Unknown protein [uncultured Thiotrichaceae bacterium]